MRKLLTALLLGSIFVPLAFAAIELPDPPDGYVLDEAEVLSEETEATLEAQLELLESETSIEIAVVTISSLQDYAIEEFALEIGREWGVGQEAHDNGVVFLIAPKERTARIEVGYGLEGAITDAQSNAILGVIIPYFVDADYDTGILEGTSHIETLARGEEFDLEEVYLDDSSDFPLLIMLLIYGLPLLWALLSWFSSSKAWWLGGVFGGVFGVIVAGLYGLAIGAVIGLFLDYSLSTFLFKKIKIPKGKGGHGGWFGGSGSSSGGFGGFGGGGFGGGGAGGSW